MTPFPRRRGPTWPDVAFRLVPYIGVALCFLALAVGEGPACAVTTTDSPAPSGEEDPTP